VERRSVPLHPGELEASALDPALERLAADGVVAYPTETVWGLGACADRPEATRRLFAWKGRAAHNPLAVLVDGVDAAIALGAVFDAPARRLAEQFWPGPLMLVVPFRGRLAPGVTREDGALGLRCSPHPVARALVVRLVAEGLGPLTSTSLNRSGQPPARCLDEALAALGLPSSAARGPVSAVFAEPGDPLLVAPPGFDAGGEAPSTVVDCTKPTPEILREGAIARGDLMRVWSAEEIPRR
jgi:L-threonylcarbamoyladenylate synthase